MKHTDPHGSPIDRLSNPDILFKMRPPNKQLSRLLERVCSRGIQEQVIAHWNKTRRLPEGFLRIPFFAPTHKHWARQEAAV